MQVKKSDIKEKILEISKAEFMEHGYKDASMRTIAKKTGVNVKRPKKLNHLKSSRIRVGQRLKLK